MDDHRKSFRAWNALECRSTVVSPADVLPENDLAFFLLDLAYLAHPVKKIGNFRLPALQIPAFFVVDRTKTACSEDLAS